MQRYFLLNIDNRKPGQYSSPERKWEEPAVSKAPVVSLLPGRRRKPEEAEILRKGRSKKRLTSYAVQSPSGKKMSAPQAARRRLPNLPYTLDPGWRASWEKRITAQLLFIAEQYLGGTLSPSDVKSILFFSDHLHFSDDLIDYLLQYCVERAEKDFRYIEKVCHPAGRKPISLPPRGGRNMPAAMINAFVIPLWTPWAKPIPHQGKKRNSSAAGVRICWNRYYYRILWKNRLKPPTNFRFEYAGRIWPPGRKRSTSQSRYRQAGRRFPNKPARQSPAHRIVPLIKYNRFVHNDCSMTPWSGKSFCVTESVW